MDDLEVFPSLPVSSLSTFRSLHTTEDSIRQPVTALKPPRMSAHSQCKHKTILSAYQPPRSPTGANLNTSCCVEEPRTSVWPSESRKGWGKKESIIQSLSKHTLSGP